MAATRHRDQLRLARGFFRKARVARTRGPDYDNPVNRSDLKLKPRKERRRPGQPTKYDEEFCNEAYRMFEGGATDREVAEHFGVTTTTMWRWRLEHPEFKEACERGKENIDGRVERSMLERAVGYEYQSEKVFQSDGTIIRAPTRVHVPADPGAALNWLKNRKRDVWRDTKDVELSGGVDITDKTGTREMALAMLQTMREAMLDAESLPATIDADMGLFEDGGPERGLVKVEASEIRRRREEAVYTPATERPRRRFE